MDVNGLGSDVPRGSPLVVSSEAWINSLFDYVNTMRATCPGVTHPLDDWLTNGINVLSSDQKPSAVGGSTFQSDSSRDKSLVDIRRTLDEHTRQNTAIELRARQNYLAQWEKDRRIRVNSFSNKIAQYHAGDLFDKETFILDRAEHARHLIPNLAPLVGQPLSNSANFESRVDNSKF